MIGIPSPTQNLISLKLNMKITSRSVKGSWMVTLCHVWPAAEACKTRKYFFFKIHSICQVISLRVYYLILFTTLTLRGKAVLCAVLNVFGMCHAVSQRRFDFHPLTSHLWRFPMCFDRRLQLRISMNR